MYKLIRFYNQNRRKILIIILIIVFIIAIIQILNYFAKNKENENNTKKNSTSTNYSNVQELVSDKSAISGQSISENKLKEDTEIINQFFKYCNDGNIESAYGILTDECKEEMFPTIEDFYKIYYINVFNGEKRTHTIENWSGDVYKVDITGDILSTGKLNDSNTKQDYMTIVKKDKKNKLNINNYIGREEVNKTTENNDIKITVKSIDTYIDYQIYDLSIENNSNNSILLDTSEDTKSVYLLDKNKMKYYFYNNEIIQNKLQVQSKFSTNIKIKFANAYTSNRLIKSLVFSKMVLNYDEYAKSQNKNEYNDFYEFKVNI